MSDLHVGCFGGRGYNCIGDEGDADPEPEGTAVETDNEEAKVLVTGIEIEEAEEAATVLVAGLGEVGVPVIIEIQIKYKNLL